MGGFDSYSPDWTALIQINYYRHRGLSMTQAMRHAQAHHALRMGIDAIQSSLRGWFESGSFYYQDFLPSLLQRIGDAEQILRNEI